MHTRVLRNVRLVAVAALLCAFLPACDDGDDPVAPPANNEYSSLWSGDYAGSGYFVNPGLDVRGYREAVVRIRDLGDNTVRIEVDGAEPDARIPPLDIQGLVRSRTDLDLVCSDGVHVHSCSLERSDGRLVGSLVVQEMVDSIKCWSLTQIDAVK